MKKRLLSAALAFAMVLTMLPLSALPAFAADTPETLYYFKKDAAFTNVDPNASDKTASASGWYRRTPGSTTGKYEYNIVGSGVVATTSKTNAAWYNDVNDALAANKSSLTLLGDISSGDAILTNAPAATLTIDTNGKSITFTGALIQGQTAAEVSEGGAANTKLTTLTLTSTALKADGKTTDPGSVTWSVTSINNQSFTLNATDVEITASSGIKLEHTKDVSGNLTVNLTRATVSTPSGGIVLDNLSAPASGSAGTKANTLTVKAVSDEFNVSGGVHSAVEGNIAAYNAKVTVTATSGQSFMGTIESRTAEGVNAANQRTGVTLSLAARSTVQGVTIFGGTSSVNMNGMSQITPGGIYLYGAKKGDNTTSPTTTPTWKTTVTVDGTSTIDGGIHQVANSGDENGHTINIKGGSVVGGIDMSVGGKHTITIADSDIASGGSPADIDISAGTLTITNSTAGDITAGLEDETSAVTITVGKSGTTDTSKVGNISKKTASPADKKVATPVLNLYPGAEVGTVGSGVSKKIFGGTVANSNNLNSGITADDLQGSLKNGYVIRKGDGSGPYTYTFTTDFQDLIDAFSEVYSVPNQVVLAFLANDSGDRSLTVTFRIREDGSDDILINLSVSPNVFINLPSVVNKSPVSYWYLVDPSQTDPDNSEGLPVDNRYYVTKDVTLAAQVSDRTDHIVTNVRAKDDWSSETPDKTPIAATLSGNTINLSGAVKTTGGAGKITLEFEVDGSYAGGQKVTVGWDSETGTIQLAAISGVTNVVFPTLRTNEVKVFDQVYVVTGTGLKSMVSHVEVGSLTGNGESPSAFGVQSYIVVPNASAGMSGSYVELGKDMKAAFENVGDASKTSKVDFNAATDVQAALNAQIASLSESSVNNYLNQARNAMASFDKKYNDAKNATANDYLGYDTLVLTPYLEISSSNPTITGNNQNTILTLTITLKARYTVRESDPINGRMAYKDDGKGNKVNWETTMALNAGDEGRTDITLKMPAAQTLVFGDGAGGGNPSYVHHDGQVYTVTWSATKSATINNLNGFTNKTFVINNTAPVAEVQVPQAAPSTGYDPAGSYDNLQDAVDAVKNNGRIVVSENFNGTINVTGEARKFTIIPKDNRTTVSLTGINGANTTYAFDKSSNEYEIQLTKDSKSNATIRVTAVSNGTAAVNMTNAAGGTTITITTTASNGYRALTPTVTANNGASVSVTANSNGTYSFTVPSGATSVTVTPSFVPSSGSTAASLVPFTDVSTNAWYYDGVAYCYNNYGDSGVPLMQGLSSTNFGASSLMTRAELVEILWRIEGSPAESAVTSFTDVQSGYWAYNSITWAANHGLVTGYGNNDFQPNRNISRQELAVILWRYAGQPNASMNLAATYPDGQGVATWAQSAMQWAASRGVLSGRSSVALNRLDAYAQAYRSELAVTIMKFHQAYIV